MPNDLGRTQTTDSLPLVGSFFASQGEKRTYKSEKVPLRMVRVSNNRHQAAVQVAAELAAFPATWVSNAVLSAEQILASPHFLVGTIDQVVADLQMRRERYGISYITVFGDSVDTFSPVVARLAGS